MKLFKNYKKLYLNELENRKLLTTQNSKLSSERKAAKAEASQLQIALEDMTGFYSQEKAAKEALLKERTKLRKLVTKLGGDWGNGD